MLITLSEFWVATSLTPASGARTFGMSIIRQGTRSVDIPFALKSFAAPARDDDLPPSEQTGIERKQTGSEQRNRYPQSDFDPGCERPLQQGRCRHRRTQQSLARGYKRDRNGRDRRKQSQREECARNRTAEARELRCESNP